MTKDQLSTKLRQWSIRFYDCVMCARADVVHELADVLDLAALYVDNSDSLSFAEWVTADGMQTVKFKGRHVCSQCGKLALNDILGREQLSTCCPNCGLPMKKGKS